MGYKKRWSPIKEVTDDSSQLEWCLAHPPVPGTTFPMDERFIEIAKAVRIGDKCGAQVVLTTDGLIAKIYDPLYYDFYDDFFRDSRIDVVDYADRDYITEAAAYSELRNTLFPGSIMPAYHGSWTLNVPILDNDRGKSREVRLIIMEHVTGTSMLDLDPSSLACHERENIMIKLIEADVALHFSGVRHDDLEPRNIVLSLSNTSKTYEDGSFRLCIIDFATCALSKDNGRKGPTPKAHNPLFYWVGRTLWSDWGWLPPRGEAADWMWKTWGNGGKNGKYVVAKRDPNSKLGKPVHWSGRTRKGSK
jgi:serine/threonine protein kinase